MGLHDWTIRQTTEGDRGVVTTLLHNAEKKHQHLDWREPEDMLHESPFLLGFKGSTLMACIACPIENAQYAWMRIFAVREQRAIETAWKYLWSQTLSDLKKYTLNSLAALVLPKWFEDLLVDANFIETNSVIFYERNGGESPPKGNPLGSLRGMRPEDLDAVFELDTRAFTPLWQNSRHELLEALKLSTLATVFERDGRIIGYQLSTVSALGGHLARLAVDPQCQGQGIGTTLVGDMIESLSRRGFDRITVNTQGDNDLSHRLYRRLGFKETGDRYPVYEYLFKS